MLFSKIQQHNNGLLSIIGFEVKMQQPTTEFNLLQNGIVAMRLSSFITSDGFSCSMRMRMRNTQSGLKREYSQRYRVRNYFYCGGARINVPGGG